MGQFIVAVDAVGNHGCQREIKDGGTVIGCERPQCTDCITREYVRRLKRSGATMTTATIVHWPTQPNHSVTDDLLTGLRTGSF
jgi:hypothetical protein